MRRDQSAYHKERRRLRKLAHGRTWTRNGREDLNRHAWLERFGLLDTLAKPSRFMTDALMCQLSMCRDDDARMLILGISRATVALRAPAEA